MGVPIYFASEFSLLAPLSCLVDSTPPVFAGITGLIANANGSLTASWAAATDLSTPIKYQVYVQAVTAVGLFATIPIATVEILSSKVFVDTVNALLQNGVTYHVGVRAVDAVGNLETNVVSMSAVSQGVPSTSLTILLNQIIATLGLPSLTIAGDINTVNTNVLLIPTNPLLTTDTRLNNLDATISSRAPASTALSDVQWTNARALNLDNLDTTVSSRLSSASYVAPNNADISAIKTDVENATTGLPAIKTAVDAIPINPLLTTDARLNNLDTTVSSREPSSDPRLINLDAPISGIVSQTTSIASDLKRALGLMQENFYLDQPVYDNGNLTSARLRIYTDAISVGTAINVLATYLITVVLDPNKNVQTYKVTQQ